MRYFDSDLFRRLVQKYPFLLPILALSAAGGITGLVIAVMWMAGYGYARPPRPDHEPPAVVRREPPANVRPQPPAPAPKPKPAPKPATPPRPPSPPDWGLDGDRGAILGERYIRVSAARIAEFDGYGSFEYSGKKVLFIDLDVKNMSESSKVEFSGWNFVPLFGESVKLEDDFGNTYNVIDATGQYSRAKMAQGGSIYPGKTVHDSLRFQLPVDKAKELRLTLPRSAFRERDVIRFVIPADSIRKPSPN